jgi:putative heme-binding domain-containing protein
VAKLSDTEKTALKPILEAEPVRKSPRELLAAREVVKKWTLSELLPLAEHGLSSGRDFERGRRLYSEVACAACHRFDNDGGSVGPDLSALSGRFGVRDILESILEPSKVISDQYTAVNIVKTNGKTVMGRIANLHGENVEVVEDMLDPGHVTRVRRSDIETMEMSKVSVMPEGLLDSLKEEEVLDLLAYLLSRGDRGHKMFRK